MTERQMAIRAILKAKNKIRLKKDLSDNHMYLYKGVLMMRKDIRKAKAKEKYNIERHKSFKYIHKFNWRWKEGANIPQTMCALKYNFLNKVTVTNSKVTCTKCREMM